MDAVLLPEPTDEVETVADADDVGWGEIRRRIDAGRARPARVDRLIQRREAACLAAVRRVAAWRTQAGDDAAIERLDALAQVLADDRRQLLAVMHDLGLARSAVRELVAHVRAAPRLQHMPHEGWLAGHLAEQELLWLTLLGLSPFWQSLDAERIERQIDAIGRARDAWCPLRVAAPAALSAA
jgi:hypothetical protein